MLDWRIMGVYGAFGSGKTLLLTYFGLKLAENPNVIVYANFEIKHKKIHSNIDYEEFLHISPKKKDALVLLSEIYAWMDSRISTSRANRVLSWCVFQCRKRNMRIIYDAQMPMSVDLRLRQECDIIVECRKFYVKNENVFVYKVFYQPEWHLKTGGFIFREQNAKYLYDKFDTRQIVMPIENIFPKVKKK